MDEKRATRPERRAQKLALVFACAMSVGALAQVPAPAPAGNAENGRKLFKSNGCYQCHGYEAQGATATGPRLGPRPLAFTAFTKYVRQPTGQMPPYTTKVVTDATLADIYAFLQSLPAPPSVDAVPLLK
jgi:ubiquinol-cytochrome c reductase cytochrome c subunit